MPGAALLPAGNYVIANWGRWVVNCASPACASAMQVWPGQEWVRCADCATLAADLIWPADPDGIEILLSMRPAEWNRNWLPGETLEDLLVENVAHGIFPPAVELEPGGPSRVLLRTAGDRIAGGLVAHSLRSDSRRHEIERTAHGVDHPAHRGR